MNTPVLRFRQRLLRLLATLLVAGPASAASTRADAPVNDARIHIVARQCNGAASAVACSVSPGSAPGDAAVDDVRGRIAARDCTAAASRLKGWLKLGEPKVLMLAATMYEDGLCVKRDWSSAVTFYIMAFEKGLPEAAERLAAGYADPANGPDIAAALWWAPRGRNAGLPACTVSKKVADDPDGFVAELGAWPEARLKRCNYMVGVISTISAELQYPKLGLAHNVGGDVMLRFLPGLARIDLTQGESREYALGWVDGDTFRDRGRKNVTGAFEKALRDVASRALARYPQPAGIPADTSVEVAYAFSIIPD